MIWNCIDDCDGLKSRQEILSRWPEHTKIINFVQNKSSIATKNLSFNRIHFAFLDGGHNYEDVKLEVEYLIPRPKKGDIIFFDDFHDTLYPGIVKAVEELEGSGKYSLKIISVNEQRRYAIGEKIV